ncbi:MAG: hypothetical protein M1816_003639 [Peltula sp. TS41687]|nr:MAG: hypothetical protein M1816_003639 [Peltula sp. TS41687]
MDRQASTAPPHDISMDPPGHTDGKRPPLQTYMSSPAIRGSNRQPHRTASTPRQVKETLNARSEYSNSSDDGQWQHRINQYIIKEEIGRGSFGAVHLAVDQHGIEYAVKEFSKSRLRKRAQSHILRLTPGVRRRPGHLAIGSCFNFASQKPSSVDLQEDGTNPLNLIQEEIAIMKKLNHPNLVALYEVLDDPAEDSLYMVLEMCKKGVVMKVGVEGRADPYDDETCRQLFRDLILGIEYCRRVVVHAQGVVHRDIKPDNCLLTHDDVLKIVDFGVSEMFEKDSEMVTAKSAGSPAFLPPELCVAKHGNISGKAADIWSMGVTLYCLRYGRIPFEKHGFLELYDAIRNDDVKYEPDTDPALVELMKRILEKDPTRRIKMTELREHPWVTSNGTDPLISVEMNTANLVEPPTDEEVESAITGNLRYLLTVVKMRAVKKFKYLVSSKGQQEEPGRMLEERRQAQSPRSMSLSHSAPVPRKAKSVDTYDRHAVEGALVSEGMHREIVPEDLSHDHLGGKLDHSAEGRHDHDSATKVNQKISSYHDSHDQSSTGKARAPPASLHPKHSSYDRRTTTGKGQAHDPREDEPPILDVGPGVPEEGLSHVISESPIGTDINVYEEAYRQEVERIKRTQGRSATVYLTRRVDDTKLPTERKIKWGNILEMARSRTQS